MPSVLFPDMMGSIEAIPLPLTPPLREAMFRSCCLRDILDFDIDWPRSKVDYSLSYALFSRLFLSYSRIVSSMELIEAREYERESGVLSLLFLSRWS